MQPRVVVVVNGGVVQSIFADAPVLVIVKDFDNIESGDKFDPNDFHQAPVFAGGAFDHELVGDLDDDQIAEEGDDGKEEDAEEDAE